MVSGDGVDDGLEVGLELRMTAGNDRSMQCQRHWTSTPPPCEEGGSSAGSGEEYGLRTTVASRRR